ncbi:hypothetical protein IFM89_015648, partial [Coptis chinensis]
LLKPSLQGLIFVSEVEVGGATPKRRTVRKFAVRGVDMDQLLDMGTNELVKLFTARAHRMFQRGLKRKPMALIKKVRMAEALDTVRLCKDDQESTFAMLAYFSAMARKHFHFK